MSKLLIIGAGGHGKVVFDLAQALNRYERIAFLDDGYTPGMKMLDVEVLGKVKEYTKFKHEFTHVFVAIGHNEIRLRLIHGLEQYFEIPNLIHPSSIVSKYASIDFGTIILAKAVINTSAVIGKGVIINTGAIIEHDTIVEDGAHISYGAIVGSQALIKESAYVDLGVVVNRNAIYE